MPQKKHVTPDQIKRIVAEFYGRSIETYNDNKRLKDNIIVKHMAMYMIKRNIPDLTNKDIAQMFGLKNHTTVISLKKKIDGYLDIDKTILRQLNQIQYFIDGLSIISDRIFIDTFLLGKSIN